jgi:ABC-type amino acid transport substrate-binding protein
VARGEIDAFVSPAPILRYEIADRFAGRLTVAGPPFLRIDYVLAMPLGSPLRKPANQSILAFVETDGWLALLRTYLGDADGL